MNFQSIIDEFKQLAPKVDYWSLRLVLERSEHISVRENVVQPPHINQHHGAYISLIDGDGFAYAATSELNHRGFSRAVEQALVWAKLSARHGILKAADIPRPQQSGHYQSEMEQAWQSSNMGDKIVLLQDINRALKIDDCIVDWQAQLGHREIHSILVTSDGVTIEQGFHYIMSGFAAVANKGSQTQRRTGGGWGTARQGGL